MKVHNCMDKDTQVQCCENPRLGNKLRVPKDQTHRLYSHISRIQAGGYPRNQPSRHPKKTLCFNKLVSEASLPFAQQWQLGKPVNVGKRVLWRYCLVP